MNSRECPCSAAGTAAGQAVLKAAKPGRACKKPHPDTDPRVLRLLEHLQRDLERGRGGNRSAMIAAAKAGGVADVPLPDAMTRQLGGRSTAKFANGPSWDFLEFWSAWADPDNAAALRACYAQRWREIHDDWPPDWELTQEPDSTRDTQAVKVLAFKAAAEIREYQQLAMALARGAEAELAELRDQINEIKAALNATRHNKAILEQRLNELLIELQVAQAKIRDLSIEAVKDDRRAAEHLLEMDRLRQENQVLRARLDAVRETEFQQIVGDFSSDDSRDNPEIPAEQGFGPLSVGGELLAAQPRGRLLSFCVAVAKRLW